MAFTEQTKNTTTLANQDPTPKDQGLTLADYGDLTIADAEGNLGNPKTPYTKQSKNTTTLANESKS